MKNSNGKLHLILFVFAIVFLLFISFLIKARNLGIESRAFKDPGSGRSYTQLKSDSTVKKSKLKKLLIL